MKSRADCHVVSVPTITAQNGCGRTLLTFTLGSLLMTPVPLHGASKSTLSNPPKTLGNSRPSYEHTTTFLHPSRCTFAVKLLVRALFASLAKMTPVFCMSAAICVVFPPGAEAMSKTRSLGCGESAMTGKNDEAAWSIYCPARYSGVAPTMVSELFIV